MKGSRLSRRSLLIGSSALAVGAAFSTRVVSAAPPAAAITPDLIAAAKKEGKLSWYTSLDLPVSERIGKAFEAKYPGVSVRVERTGAERLYQRIGQEVSANIHAVDVVQSSDAAHFIVWKKADLLAPFVPEDVAKHYVDDYKDPDGQFAAFRIFLCPMGYNTDLVKKEQAPKSFADLLKPEWKGKIVKAHPSYSGTILTATFQVSRDLGWGFFEKLAQQNIMQVQSAADPPKKLALGERSIMADGVEYGAFREKERGRPVDLIYPSEGTPLIIGNNAVFKKAPNPNAARLFQAYCFTGECQQLLVDFGGLRSGHPQAKDKPGRMAFDQIKKMKDDAEGVEKTAAELKRRYTEIFKV
jgi:iron(III) transport system substrate-binding protein